MPALSATPGLFGWPYPAEVHYLALSNEGQDVRMAYMDIAPSGAGNGRTMLLLHGKNFGGAYFAQVASHLAAAGFRVVIPDQIGFGRSSKPILGYSFDLLVGNTVALLDHLGIGQVTVLGHSTGGMLAMHLALRHPERIASLLLEDPIGLEDYQRVEPSLTLEQWYQLQLAIDDDALHSLFHTYFVHWRAEYAEQLEAPYLQDLHGGDYPHLAMVSALTYLMIMREPVVYQLEQLHMPVLIVYGDADRTAIGKANADPAVRPKLGNFAQIAPAAAALMAHGRAVAISSAGHIPHLEQFDQFVSLLDQFLSDSSAPYAGHI